MLRDWRLVVNDPKTEIGLHPEEWAVFRLGDYDEETMKISNHDVHMIGTGLEYLNDPLGFEQGAKNASKL